MNWSLIIITSLAFIFLLTPFYFENKKKNALIQRDIKTNKISIIQTQNQETSLVTIQQDKSPSIIFASYTFAPHPFNAIHGNTKAFQKKFDYAQREALIRLKEKALAQGCEQIQNIKIKILPIFTKKTLFSKQKIEMNPKEILVYGTVLK